MGLLIDPATWPRWQGEIVESSGPAPLGDGDVVAGRARMMGFDVDGQSVARSVTGDSYEQTAVVGVGMRITYSLLETSEGVRVTHRLESQLPSGMWGRVLSFFLKKRLRKMQRGLLAALKDQAEGSSG